MSSEAQTLKETQLTHEGVVLNKKLFIGNVGRIRSAYKGQVASYRFDTLLVEGVEGMSSVSCKVTLGLMHG